MIKLKNHGKEKYSMTKERLWYLNSFDYLTLVSFIT